MRVPVAGLLTRNLMDRSKLEAGLKASGWKTVTISGPQLSDGLDTLLVDLEHPSAMKVIRSATAIRCLAYGPHVDRKNLQKAQEAGADLTLPRSKLFGNLEAIAARLLE
ncbi:MAG: hypothetical protein OXH10_08395 [bacterium]|nr:hypothetical protein [bacterium]MCY3579168.1 hypothetical protein [bacterium]MCY3653254.1 hypothetical protein [bacterium]MXX63933.1 hypothetical protein [Acidimicrobiia bacterium]MYH55812.1 hypothetical protein [Acidimicrobiia bacterium]